jgi:hypothetical protein
MAAIVLAGKARESVSFFVSIFIGSSNTIIYQLYRALVEVLPPSDNAAIATNAVAFQTAQIFKKGFNPLDRKSSRRPRILCEVNFL